MKHSRITYFGIVVMCGLSLQGCGETPRPLVDMEGVDLVKHNRDLADCYDKIGKQFFSWGTDVSDCMSSKGYRVLRKQ
jgi:hypothetical protein